ncbi:MAG: hypothetical protein HY814_01715 [Candidatus Riflebacteria bacterium]|nr:hypothetical protein [Candidatus Riflebacteria bacterium]
MGECRPPLFHWHEERGNFNGEVPEWNFMREMPAHGQFRGRDLSPELQQVSEMRLTFWENWQTMDLLQDMVVAGERVYLLRGGDVPLVCLDLAGKPVSDFRGLRDPTGRPVDLPLAPGFNQYAYSMCRLGNRGAIAIADAIRSQVLLADPTGMVWRIIPMSSQRHKMADIHFDEANRVLMLADPEAGCVLRFDENGSILAPMKCPGVTAACTSPDGSRVYCLVPRRGGFVIFTPDGREVDFWRSVEIEALSRICCDRQGRLFAGAPDGQLIGFTARGEVFLPFASLWPESEELRGNPPTLAAIQVESDDRLLIGLAGPVCGWAEVKLKPRRAQSTEPELHVNELEFPGGVAPGTEPQP